MELARGPWVMCTPPHVLNHQHPPTTYHHPTFKDRHKYTLVPGVNWRVNAGGSCSKIEMSVGKPRARHSAALHCTALSSLAAASGLRYWIFQLLSNPNKCFISHFTVSPCSVHTEAKAASRPPPKERRWERDLTNAITSQLLRSCFNRAGLFTEAADMQN